MDLLIVDYDDIEAWAPFLRAALQPVLPPGVEDTLALGSYEYTEDALDDLFVRADREAIIDTTLDWLRTVVLVGYHGTRLTVEELESVHERGLIPLTVSSRKARLERALSVHPRWEAVKDQLDLELKRQGQGRESQVHLTLSRAGLTEGFNHYLEYGSELDRNVARSLLGPDGLELLKSDGTSLILRIGVPGEVALAAGHPYFSIDDMRAQGDVPNLVRPLLEAWCFRLSRPGYKTASRRLDCGLVFREPVPAEWLLQTEKFDTC